MNKVILIGNLTREPELRTTSTGVPVCAFGLAVNRRMKNAQGKQETDFFNITAWRQTGERCAKYLHKGSKACVVGAVQVRNYEDSEGNKRVAVDIVADEVEFLSTPQQKQQGGEGYHQAPVPQAHTDIDDDELPF